NKPFTEGTSIGTDWQQFTKVMAADVSGDGHADALGIRPDGTMWYFPNNMDSNAGGRPFTTKIQVGKDWQQFVKVIAGDYSGDGHADLVAVRADGTMRYYPNNMDSNPDHLPFTTGQDIGGGWEIYNKIV
ncbi:FG-GAP-like repeat-containing protein, partial [Micromonospora sp. NPDC049047]